MIARIEGLLESVEGNTALVRIGQGQGALVYEVLVSAYAAGRLAESVGRPVALQTRHFIESQGQGTTMIPRLAGFVSAEDRDFFELFTTCKGIGNKRALRAMAMETGRIAAAIADRDVKTLQMLPEIGRRMAETVVATLNGKVDAFASAAVVRSAAAGGAGASSAAVGIARQAMEVLLTLGENRVSAVAWIDEALRDEKDRPADAEALVQKVYRIKAGG